MRIPLSRCALALLTTLLAACPSQTQQPAPSLTELPGDPARPVNAQLADLPFPAPRAQDFALLPSPEAPLFAYSRREMLLVFADSATLADANALLRERQAEVVGITAVTHLLLLRFPDASDPGPIAKAWSELRSDPRVAASMVEDAFMGPQCLPPYNLDPSRWEWTDPPYLGGASEGNWGPEMTRPWATAHHIGWKRPWARCRIGRARVRPRGPLRRASRASGTGFGLTGTTCRFHLTRAPQAWNLRDWLREHGHYPTDVAAIEGDYNGTNPDLEDIVAMCPTSGSHNWDLYSVGLDGSNLKVVAGDPPARRARPPLPAQWGRQPLLLRRAPRPFAVRGVSKRRAEGPLPGRSDHRGGRGGLDLDARRSRPGPR